MENREGINTWLIVSAFIFSIFFLASCGPTFGTTVDILTPGMSIKNGENVTLISAKKSFELGFFRPEDSANYYIGIWFHPASKSVWVANGDNPLTDSTGVFSIFADGNLVIQDGNGNPKWSTNIATTTPINSTAVLLESGNLVLREGNYSNPGRMLWQSFDHPCDTLLPGMKIGINLTSGRTTELRAWTDYNNPAPGIFTFGIDPQGLQQFIIWRRSLPQWRVFYCNGTQAFVGHQNSNLSIIRNKDEVYLTFSTDPKLALMDHSGAFFYFNVPRDVGDGVDFPYIVGYSEGGNICFASNLCGPNSICNVDSRPPCKCLHGFVPLFPRVWESGDWSDGCVRHAKVQCGEKDSFYPMKRMRMPEPSEKDKPLIGEDCESPCDQRGCLCTAYAHVNNSNGLNCYLWSDDFKGIEEVNMEGFGFDVNLRIATSESDKSGRSCSDCGTNFIPYPLSAGPDCGDPAYHSFRCDNSTGELKFIAADKAAYTVSGISPETRTFIIQLKEPHLTCQSKDLNLNPEEKFHVSKNNTIFLLNCSNNKPPFHWDCSSSSACNRYIWEGAAPCFILEKCCSHVAGESLSVGVSNTGCSTYTSFINVNYSEHASSWLEGVLIEWDAPQEPICISKEDCSAWNNSRCLPDMYYAGRKRCLCDTDFWWDSSHLTCTFDGKGKRKETKGFWHKIRLLLTVTIISAVVPGVFGNWLWTKISRIRGSQRTESLFEDSKLGTDEEKALEKPIFSFESIMAATENFSESNKLGQGGFGPVYKGKLPSGQEIAVKRLSKSSIQGLQEFENEILLIAKLQHRNLVNLVGYCIEGDEKLLLYEYMPNRSLDSFLFDSNQRNLLEWEKRFNIILGIARGLLYLHHDSRLRIIHRDLKTSNILLDEEMNPKISDFGLARIIGGNQTPENTTRVVGTYGYMPREYVLHGLFSIKSDVFSFGVILLEIVSGLKNTRFYNCENDTTLLEHAWRLWKDNKMLELIDPLLTGVTNIDEVFKCIQVGLLCVQDKAADRPSIASVILMLGSDNATLPPPKEPAFCLGSLSNREISSDKPRNNSKNELTISTPVGR